MAKKSLGVIPIQDRTVEYDFDIQTRYQDFTAEILRLSLLGISAVGFVVIKHLFPEKEIPGSLTNGVRLLFNLSLLGFGCASVSALVHRYVSVDSLSWHLQAIRKEERGEPGDAEGALADRKQRYLRFRLSRWAVITGAVGIGFGACCLAAAFYILMKK